MFATIDSIRQAGFSGFYTVEKLWDDHTVIPSAKGIYLIVQPSNGVPVFLPKGSGGFFKQRDPNIPVEDLAKRWIEGCKVLYVGKAGGVHSNATLRSRLKQYLDFGKGRPVGHYGGRLIWQLQHHAELLVAWREVLDSDPRTEEVHIIDRITDFYGQGPFANLVR